MLGSDRLRDEAARRASRSDRALVGTDLVTRLSQTRASRRRCPPWCIGCRRGSRGQGAWRWRVTTGLGTAQTSAARPWREGAIIGLLCVLHDPGSPARASGRLAVWREPDPAGQGHRRRAMADTVETVTMIVTTHTADAVARPWRARRSGRARTCSGWPASAAAEGEAQQWETFPILTRTPASDVIRSGERLVLTGAAAIAERYPDLPASNRGQRSLVCLPLRVTTRTIGAIGLSFPGCGPSTPPARVPRDHGRHVRQASTASAT